MTAQETPNFSFHHIGIITPEPEKTAQHYHHLGYQRGRAIEDKAQKVWVEILKHHSGPLVELVTPIDNSSPAWAWQEKLKVGPYHTCYGVPILEQAFDFLRNDKWMPVTPITFSPVSENRIVFLWNAQVGLVEILELPKE